jgi:hypothetical protein
MSNRCENTKYASARSNSSTKLVPGAPCRWLLNFKVFHALPQGLLVYPLLPFCSQGAALP